MASTNSTSSAQNGTTNLPPAKRQRISTNTPKSFVTWNCNGLVSRCKYNLDDLKRLVQETESPDVILLQEVRLKALSSSQRDQPSHDDSKAVTKELNEVFSDYDTKIWSLAETRYAGTLTLLHKRLETKHIVKENNAAFTFKGAIQILLQRYNLKRSDVGIPEEDDEEKPENNKTKKKGAQQKSLKSFFTATKKVSPAKQHQKDGRLQFLQFQNLDLLHTYVPNNGNKQESFDRRKEWDQDMKEFLIRRLAILQNAGKSGRPLLWIGDLNVAREYRDGTHWSQNEEDGTIYEWWTDESKCFVVPPKEKNREAENLGMPSFTPGERSRFQNILEEAKLTDIWRDVHPNGVKKDSLRFDNLSTWELPNYTWRGHLSRDGNVSAKYQGKAQRIDYFLASGIDLDGVEDCQILGYGERKKGLYCGSDHCASILRLK